MKMSLRDRYLSFTLKHFNKIAIAIIIVFFGNILVTVLVEKYVERKKGVLAKVQILCDKEVQIPSRAVMIQADSFYCETDSGVLFKISFRCGEDDLNCDVALRACKKIGFSNVSHVSNGVIACADKSFQLHYIRL